MDGQVDGETKDGHIEPEVPCVICKKPVSLLSSDICSDEHGNPVHEECYTSRIAHSDGTSTPASAE
ncbi:MAG: hypothetical protein WB566_14450 [Terriglobales bacterium]